MQTFEVELAERFEFGELFNRDLDPTIDQNLSVARLRAKTSREIDHGPDRAVFRAALETNSAERRISICDADSKTEFVPFVPPLAR